MAYKDFDGFSLNGTTDTSSQTLEINGSTLELPDASYIRDANILREGADLVLDGPQGTITVEGYFSAEQAPTLVAPDGTSLTPQLVESFSQSPAEYAQSLTMTDESPVGQVSEISGEATITRTNGQVEPISLGTPVYQGDIVETASDGALNITFSDDSSFAVSEDARLAIDEYVYDDTGAGEGVQSFSVLKGVFVFTSGLVGRDDPDDVTIDTPSGSIGIRGTIIAGNADTGEITVVEGAIVLRDGFGNELTLANQFETAKFMTAEQDIKPMGELAANDMMDKFEGISQVAPAMFSSIDDAAGENSVPDAPQEAREPVNQGPNGPKARPEGEADNMKPNANGSVDQNSDNEVDSSIENAADTAEDGDASGEETGGGEMMQPDLDGNTENTGPESNARPQSPSPMQMMQMNSNQMMGMQTGLDTATNEGAGAMEMGEINTAMDMVDAEGDMHMVGDDAPQQNPAQAEMREQRQEAREEARENQQQNQEQDSESVAVEPPPQEPPPMMGGGGGGAAPFSIRNAIQSSTLEHNETPSIAPDEFFISSEGQTFEYHFDKEFWDIDSPNLAFELSAATIAQLDANFSGNWTFNGAPFGNGRLIINVPNSLPGDVPITIDVRAFDGSNYSNFETYNFAAVDTNSGLAMLNSVGAASNNNTISVAGPQTFTISPPGSADNNQVFFGNSADDITLNSGNDNLINLGNGLNQFTVNNGDDNVVIGGAQRDTFTINDGDQEIYGMDGDDIFRVDGTVDLIGPSTAGNGYVLDGGHSQFRAGQALRGHGVSYNHGGAGDTGYGDTVVFTGTFVNLDFSSVDSDYFRGIERIDLTETIGIISNLTYADIVNITDHKNTLIIRGDNGGDAVDFGGLLSGNQVADNVFIDDDYDGANPAESFDVYQVNGADGPVTVLIEQIGGSDAVAIS